MIYIYVRETQGQWQNREGNQFLSGKAEHSTLPSPQLPSGSFHQERERHRVIERDPASQMRLPATIHSNREHEEMLAFCRLEASSRYMSISQKHVQATFHPKFKSKKKRKEKKAYF